MKTYLPLADLVKELEHFLKLSTTSPDNPKDFSKQWIINRDEEKALKTVISLLHDCI